MNLQKLSLKELREMAREKGLSGVSGLRKADLIHEIEKFEVSSSLAETRPAVPKKETKEEAKSADQPATQKEKTEAETEPASKTDAPQKKRQTYTYVPNHAGSERSHSRSYSSGSNADSHRTDNKYESRHDGRPGTVSEAPQYRTIEDVVKAGLITIAKDRQVTDVHPTEMKELDSGITKKGILEIMSEGYGFIRCDNFLPGENDVYVSPAFLRRFGLRTGDIIEGNLRVKTDRKSVV